MVTYDTFPSSHKTFIFVTTAIHEPQNYKEASQNPLWVEAMDKELKALADNNTWDIVDLPPGKKPIGYKWVYKIKRNADGTVLRDIKPD